MIGHSLQGMDVHYLIPTEGSLKAAMERYTDWLDERISETLDKTLDKAQNEKINNP